MADRSDSCRVYCRVSSFVGRGNNTDDADRVCNDRSNLLSIVLQSDVNREIPYAVGPRLTKPSQALSPAEVAHVPENVAAKHTNDARTKI